MLRADRMGAPAEFGGASGASDSATGSADLRSVLADAWGSPRVQRLRVAVVAPSARGWRPAVAEHYHTEVMAAQAVLQQVRRGVRPSDADWHGARATLSGFLPRPSKAAMGRHATRLGRLTATRAGGSLPRW